MYGSDFYINQSNPNLLAAPSQSAIHGHFLHPSAPFRGNADQTYGQQAEHVSNAADSSWYSNYGHYATIGGSPPADHHKSVGARLNNVSNLNQLLGTTTPQLRRKLLAISQHIPGSMWVIFSWLIDLIDF